MYREATLTLTSSLIAATVVVFVAVCVVTDLRTRRIPNAISGPAMLIGIAPATMFQAAALTRSLGPLRVSAADQGAVALPYSVPLGLGTLAALIGAARLGL